MVMANTPDKEAPSAQNVGSEFVRQYYTLLNEAPYHLHRFYSHNSTFVHGGVEKPGETVPPVKGQQEIHNKILGLNFRDCHAKIRQVDAQPTVGHGVVIQVTGELSNNGQPMRRFMQTFVLGLQAAKQYYVHNDIFRYQDEVFSDEEETETEEAEVAAETVENGAAVEPAQPPQDSQLFFEQPVAPVSNGSVQEEEPEQAPVVVVEQNKTADGPELEADIDSLDIEEEQNFEKPEPAAQPVEAPTEPEPEPQPVEPKPFSWAALASKNTQSAVGGSQSTPTFGTTSQIKPTRPVEPKPEAPPAPSASAPTANSQPQPQRVRPPRGEGRFERDRSNMSRGEEGDGDNLSGRRTGGGGGGGVGTKYPDSQQLFVGNLPHNISERELKVFFEHWGKVVELRINTKSSGGKLPNFGFVVFDSPEPVQEVLKQKPIKFNGEHRLNVEEKKPRGSEGRMGGRGAPRGGGGGPPRGGFSGRGGMKSGGGFGRPNDGEQRGMGGMRGGPRGAMSGPSRR